MNIEAFCYLGLLKYPEQIEPSLALLPENQRQEASSLIASLKDLPRAEIVHRWSKLRSEEYEEVSGNAYKKGGVCLDNLPPSIREWWVLWLERQNG